MKKPTILVACLFLGAPALMLAEEAGHHQHGGHAGHDRAGHDHDGKAPKAGTLKQTTCPVSGKPIDEGKSLDYEGRKVYFCCDGCIGKFKQAPEEYLPALYRQIYPQNRQVKCPVMGGEVDPTVFADHGKRRIYFCCRGCDKKFKANPAKYLPKLKDVSTDQVHCPVSGKPIDPEQSLEVKGKTIYFCCKNCIAKYKADPDKYADALRPEAGLLAHGATAKDDLLMCSVCLPEGAVHKRADVEMVVHKGIRYAVCNSSCAKAFKAAPDKYVKALQKEMIRRAGDEPVYTCSMHPGIIRKGPGACPLCEMKLTPVKRGE